MSFLFGKKKPLPHAAAASAPRDTQASGGSTTPTLSTVSTIREKDKSPSTTQITTPGSSINNSLNSLGGGATPSPEHRGGPEQDSQVQQFGGQRPGINGPALSNVNQNPLYPWSQKRLTFTSSQPNPFPRYGAAVNATSSKDGDIYLMGGLVNGSTVKGDLWMIEAGGGNLACYPIGTTSEGPGPRVGHASLLVGNAFIIFGGDTKQDERDLLDDTLYLLNTSTRQWSRASPPGFKPAGRYGHTLNILGSKIYVFGGQVETHFFNDLIAFDLNALQDPKNEWELLIPDSIDGGPPEGQTPPGRTNHTIVTYNDKLYLFGGTDGAQWFSDVWSYDPRTNAWTQLDCIGYIPAPREGHSAALVNDVMYIFGGRSEEGTDLGDLAAFRITSRRWYTFQNMGASPSPRSGHSMTAYNKQIVVLAGEPSSTPADPGELSLVYILDTAKIRYPTDQQIQQTPSAERVPGNRRPSAERSALPQSKGMLSRDPPSGPPDGPKRMFSGSRESIAGGPGTVMRGHELVAGNASPSSGPGSRLPRALGAQAPSGPPPLQQAPQPRTKGVVPAPIGSRSRTPTAENRALGPSIDTSRGGSFEREDRSPSTRDSPRGLHNRAMSPVTNAPNQITNGRRTPTQQPLRLANTLADEEQQTPTHAMQYSIAASNRQQRPSDEINPIQESSPTHNWSSQSHYDGTDDKSLDRDDQKDPDPVLLGQIEALIKELDAAKSHNAWYLSELALARKAGYHQNSSQDPIIDGKTVQSLSDGDRPLIEALLAMRTELANVQSSVESRVQEAAEKVVEAEQQREIAIREAAFAKAKLAAHGGSHAGTPQLDDTSRDLADSDRSIDISHKLSSALALQESLRAKVDFLTMERDGEKRAREMAEGNADAAQRRAVEFSQTHNPGEIESLKASLYQVEKMARDEAAQRGDAQSKTRLLEIDKEDLSHQLEEAINTSNTHAITLGALREAVSASEDKSSLFGRKLDEEREHREALERKLLHLKSEYEERTNELEAMTRKLRDTEELAEKHSNEAQAHRNALVSGLDKLSTRGLDDSKNRMVDERVAILQQHVNEANALVRRNQTTADNAAEKLRRTEERIVSLESNNEQANQEILDLRKQLQEALRNIQLLQTQHNEARQQLEVHQRDASALAIQHSALKELLKERPLNHVENGRSREVESPNGSLTAHQNDRVRELEQQLMESRQVHEEMLSNSESKEQAADRAYREKLEQLEQDYQSAVHYVKGTEKMLKRMKDELTKYKGQNARLQSEIEDSQRLGSNRSIDADAPTDWQTERQSMMRQIEEMQESLEKTNTKLDRQLEAARSELQRAQEEHDNYRTGIERAQHELSQASQRAQMDIQQLRIENANLESRAIDAENKVSMLLDQVESSVDNYRRQSQIQTNGFNHIRNPSTNSTLNLGGHSQSNSIGADSAFSTTAPDNRNSLALDSLASELETLRTQWEGTHRTNRLSSQFDFERAPASATGGELSDSLASWRKRLDAEERDKENSRSPVHSPTGGLTNGRVASPRGGEIERERARGGWVSPLRRHDEETSLNVI